MISDLVTRKCSPRLSTLEEDMGDVLGGVFSELDWQQMGRAVFHAGRCLPDDGGNDFRFIRLRDN
ncbi:MAG: hypothetical protein WA706_15405 [Pseudolabrys sp.]